MVRRHVVAEARRIDVAEEQRRGVRHGFVQTLPLGVGEGMSIFMEIQRAEEMKDMLVLRIRVEFGPCSASIPFDEVSLVWVEPLDVFIGYKADAVVHQVVKQLALAFKVMKEHALADVGFFHDAIGGSVFEAVFGKLRQCGGENSLLFFRMKTLECGGNGRHPPPQRCRPEWSISVYHMSTSMVDMFQLQKSGSRVVRRSRAASFAA